MSEKQFQPGNQHPEEYRHDLNPNEGAGQNHGMADDQNEKNARTAYDLKDVHARLNNLTDDNLRQILVLPVGTRLQQGGTYIDLHAPERMPFKARGDMEVEAHQWIVPKNEVDYQLWNEITGVDDAERLDITDEA